MVTAPIRIEIAVVLAGLLISVTAITPAAAQEPSDEADGVPGNGEQVVLARATWDTGWFQAAILAELLAELGYDVAGPTTTENDDFYQGVASGDIDLWANGWFPLHDDLLDTDGSRPVGVEVEGGALQGYLADRDTVERLGITDLGSLADPSVAEEFDIDSDGSADMIGCDDGWACQPIVDHHLDAYGLAPTVTQVTGDYGPLMQDAVERYEAGEPVLFYTFTPNWTVGELVPGDDVVWLPVPFASLPGENGVADDAFDLAGINGCLDDPCSIGFPPSDIRSVANADFLAEHPAIEVLLERFSVPLDDILAQNASLLGGQDSAEDIQADARSWISSNRELVDSWFADATEAHLDAGGELFPRQARVSGAAGAGTPVGPLRVVTRIAPPFVSYDGEEYGGFSLELLQLVGDDIGADIELYAVNSTAKLVDDVTRGEAAVGAGAIAVSSGREQIADFSQPYFDSGLGIMIAERSDGIFGGRLRAVVSGVFSRDLLIVVLSLLVVLVVAAHAIWFSERGRNPEFPEDYRSGIWESFWWAAVTATTVGYGDKTPRGGVGRVFGLLWMFSGLFVLAYFTAGIATAFTIDELEGDIAGPSDLRGNTIAVPVESPALAFLDNQGTAAREYPSVADAHQALLDGEVDAVVHDAAILRHLIATDPDGSGARLTGPTFAERGFGFVVADGSELAERIDYSLLSLVESGEYQRLHDRWFGSEEGGG